MKSKTRAYRLRGETQRSLALNYVQITVQCSSTAAACKIVDLDTTTNTKNGGKEIAPRGGGGGEGSLPESPLPPP